MIIKVSAVVAAYNIDKYIEKCLESIINQTLANIEIIVVNDGSTDETLNIINKLSLKDKRLIVIDKANQGLIEARKSGLEAATGEYVLFIDGDDWLELEALDLLYKHASEHEYDIVMYNAYISYDNNVRKKFVHIVIVETYYRVF